MPKGKTVLMLIVGVLIAFDAWWLSGQAVKGWAMWNATFIGQPLAEALINTFLFGGDTSLNALAMCAGSFLMSFVLGVLLIRFTFSRLRGMALRELVSMKW